MFSTTSFLSELHRHELLAEAAAHARARSARRARRHRRADGTPAPVTPLGNRIAPARTHAA